MATSVVDICNNALVRIGSSSITSLTDTNKAAVACNTVYERTRDSLLRQHLWNFAIKRAVLASEETSPAFGFANSFPLPADFIRVKEIEDSSVRYKIEQNKLLTDADSVELVYVAQIEDSSKFDPLFVEALVLSLAINLSYILVGSNSREQILKEELQKVLFLAKQVDGQDDTPDSLMADTFLGARYGFRDPTKIYGDY